MMGRFLVVSEQDEAFAAAGLHTPGGVFPPTRKRLFPGVLSLRTEIAERKPSTNVRTAARRCSPSSKGECPMPKVVNVMQESVPALRFIGKRYTDTDRVNGGFGARWGEWFREGRFAPLEALGSAPEHEGAFIGLMRFSGEFEYWIGMFFPAGTEVPSGYDYVDLPACSFGTCWLHGREDTGELYGHDAHMLCVSEIEKQGWRIAESPWFMERYNCPRFTDPDDAGKVILDYCIQLAS